MQNICFKSNNCPQPAKKRFDKLSLNCSTHRFRKSDYFLPSHETFQQLILRFKDRAITELQVDLLLRRLGPMMSLHNIIISTVEINLKAIPTIILFPRK